MRNQWNKIQFSPSVALIRTALTFSIKMEVEEKYEKVLGLILAGVNLKDDTYSLQVLDWNTHTPHTINNE